MYLVKKSSIPAIQPDIHAKNLGKVQSAAELRSLVGVHLAGLAKKIEPAAAPPQLRVSYLQVSALQSRSRLQMAGSLAQSRLQKQGGASDPARQKRLDEAQRLKSSAREGPPEAFTAKALTLLEQAQSPEEFKKLYEQLGGCKLKYETGANDAVKNPLLAQLEALSKKHSMPEVGFGMAPERTTGLQRQIHEAFVKGDNAAIVRLSENSDAMKAATPGQKADMIKVLQKGWTKDSQDMAVARILGSCASKAEFDQVVDRAGGPKILKDVDYGPARAELNKTMGGFDRIDCADNKAQAQAHKGILMPPRLDELTKTRPPSDAELRDILGSLPFSEADLKNPALAQTAQALEKLRAEMGKMAHDLQADPMARNKLAIANRDRELAGKPPLDYTSLVTQAYKAANDPSFEQEVQRRIGKDGATDAEDQQKIRQEVLTERMGAIAGQYGLSEQDMKTLVTAKMGRVLSTGAASVKAFSSQIGTSLQARLGEAERTAGPQSPEAKMLREALDKLGPAAAGHADRLEKTGGAAASLFKVPTSFGEDFTKAISVAGDIAATVLSVVPGVGQTVAAIYRATKSLAEGDTLGGVTGFGGAIGGAGIKEASRFAKGVKDGDTLGALGSLAKDFGGAAVDEGLKLGKSVDQGDWQAVMGQVAQGAGALVGVGGVVGQAASVASQILNVAKTAGSVAEGARKGDIAHVLGGVAGGIGSIAAPGSDLGKVLDYTQKGIQLADGIGRGDLGAIVGAAGGLAGPLMNDPAIASIVKNPIVQDVAKLVPAAASFASALANGNAGQALSSFASELSRLPLGPEFDKTLGLVKDGAKIADALHNGDYARAFGGVSSQLQQMGAGPEAARLSSSLGQVPKLLEAVGSGNPQAVAEALGGKNGRDGFLDQIGGGSLSKSFSGVADLAGRTLGSPQLQQAAALAQAGTRFFSALGSGELGKTLAVGTAGQSASLGKAASELSALLDTAAPMARSMATGQFQRALGVLRTNELTRGLADQLATLEPMADLVTGRTQEAVEALQRDLHRMHGVRQHLDKLHDMEKWVQTMAERFGHSPRLVLGELLGSSQPLR